jgi:hypothetical protein
VILVSIMSFDGQLASLESMELPSFNEMWTQKTSAPSAMRLDCWRLLQTHSKEYFEKVNAENRARDLSGWRKPPTVLTANAAHVGNTRHERKKRMYESCCIGERLATQQPRRESPVVDFALTTETLSRSRRKSKSKKRKRPAAGSAKANSQTTAACE